MIEPPIWTSDELEVERRQSIDNFIRERTAEPLEAYLHEFDRFLGVFEDLLEKTLDLSQLDQHALELLGSGQNQDALRYLTGPPISKDDLEVLALGKLSKAALSRDPEVVARVSGLIKDLIDRRRFPWFSAALEPTEPERSAAILASAALIATQKTMTLRRNEGKSAQEAQVAGSLEAIGFKRVPTRVAKTLVDVPSAGEFCGESLFGGDKADFLVGLYDRRCMPIECKVSNSSTNSIKRLNKDAAIKAVRWRDEQGSRNIVPVAVLSGVFKLKNLEDAQKKGLTLFWAHRLEQLTDWIGNTQTK